MKYELILETMMISRTERNPAFRGLAGNDLWAASESRPLWPASFLKSQHQNLVAKALQPD
jgi:hypothetical protein